MQARELRRDKKIAICAQLNNNLRFREPEGYLSLLRPDSPHLFDLTSEAESVVEPGLDIVGQLLGGQVACPLLIKG